jgi:hypothetical protein
MDLLGADHHRREAPRPYMQGDLQVRNANATGTRVHDGLARRRDGSSRSRNVVRKKLHVGLAIATRCIRRMRTHGETHPMRQVYLICVLFEVE